ncbi:hypothetical protein DYU11_12665 [Fibrisoma montanum]|uniref:Uncharacterized protein n=1 Tax=Fibrisoma montanum TaxID=2305895 RepID=A0A418MBQ6_9BACT|nr:hypothetical protein [Fibrisoma montanum]RIV23813.1 hypothetical protein DYU11_12665 [Fibrisoma montanum]
MVPKPFSSPAPAQFIPTVADVDRIAALTDPVLRNLQITQCYSDVSAAFRAQIGMSANWCTFATWASKQAGQTIRREDLIRTVEAVLSTDQAISQALLRLITLAKQLDATPDTSVLQQSVWYGLLIAAADRASDAVSRGNKKVFEEIAREFARFMATCGSDTVFTQPHLDAFCDGLRPGDPPHGQRYLRQAFTHYYQSRFETDPKKQCELRLLANLEVGFHEQTRLQPEIAESLNAATIDGNELKRQLRELLFPTGSWLSRLRLSFLDLFGQTNALDKALDRLVSLVQVQIRSAITTHLMTLTFPPNVRLRLGHDLTTTFPASLRTLTNADLRSLLGQIDLSPDSLNQSGAVDWANLPERMHFIADLFRCYHESADLFSSAFTMEQITALRAGQRPTGRL